MLTQHYTAQQRRALNQIWTAAGEYGFDPLFLAMGSDGVPDSYMNCIVGCVRKWYGAEMPRKLFAAWELDRRQAMLDDLAWLALENAAFQRELPHRPVLEEARKAHAADFFGQECPGRSGGQKISWFTPCSLPGGKAFWESALR